VGQATFLGASVRLAVTTEAGRSLVVDLPADAAAAIAPDTTIALAPDPERALVLALEPA
jgi:hypothetical protein